MLTTKITLIDDKSAVVAARTDYNIVGGAGLKAMLFQVQGSNTSALTVEFRGSLSEVAPDFSAAATATNAWYPIATVDADTGSVVAGSTGIVLAADGVVLGELNLTTIPRHLTAVIENHTTGNVTVIAEITNDTVGGC